MSHHEDINGYEIAEIIGSGAFGNVYKALRKIDGYEFAMKVRKNYNRRLNLNLDSE